MARWPLGPSQTMPKETEGLLAGQGEGEQAEEKLTPLVFLTSPVKPLALHVNPGPSCLFLVYVDSLFWFFSQMVNFYLLFKLLKAYHIPSFTSLCPNFSPNTLK